VTYNFDPERWLEAHRAVLEARRDRGESDDADFEAALVELDRRYEEIIARLDGTYEIPAGRRGSVE
jgi:hypothetical protein